MDPRRLLILSAAGLSLGGCAELARFGLASPSVKATLVEPTAAAEAVAAVTAPPEAGSARVFASMAPIEDPPALGEPAHRRPARPRERATVSAGRAAIAAANVTARETSQAHAFLGGVQVFAYEPGRVYEVWAAPLRVTTLSLSPGESVVSKAAGDTVRWQIGETESGEGPSRRAHVMIKPLERDLETNLVLATNRRIYLVQLRSGAPDAFNAVVTWDVGALLGEERASDATVPSQPGLVAPQGPLDARFRITPKGRRPAWTPRAVMTDGVRTFLTFPPSLAAGEAPALFAVSPSGATQLLNYRQQGGLWVVDRVLDAAELRVGGRKAQVVRIERLGAAS